MARRALIAKGAPEDLAAKGEPAAVTSVASTKQAEPSAQAERVPREKIKSSRQARAPSEAKKVKAKSTLLLIPPPAQGQAGVDSLLPVDVRQDLSTSAVTAAVAMHFKAGAQNQAATMIFRALVRTELTLHPYSSTSIIAVSP